jgi:hypothetical protein
MRALGHLLLLIGIGACGRAARPPDPRVDLAPLDAGVAADASRRAHPGPDHGAKHVILDELDGGVAPVNHGELLWGDYVDRQGRAAIGWHSHDPVTGNAR